MWAPQLHGELGAMKSALAFLAASMCFFAEIAHAQRPAAQSGETPSSFGAQLSEAAVARTEQEIVYDASYVRLAYPMGDVPPDRGVCADVVVRALRALEIDLQVLVHEDMRANFSAYPAHWGLERPDRNIDHRRVPNLETFLTREGAKLPPSANAADYLPGDIVAWNLRGDAGWLPHIGIVTDRIGPTGRPMVVHNIGAGPKLEDVLFDWPITGRYRVSADLLGAHT